MFDFPPENHVHVQKLIRRYGIPAGLRSHIWPALLGADIKLCNSKKANKRFYYNLVLKYESAERRQCESSDQGRPSQNNGWTSGAINQLGLESLEMSSFSQYNSRVGYCQSMNFGATLLRRLLAGLTPVILVSRCASAM